MNNATKSPGPAPGPRRSLAVTQMDDFEVIAERRRVMDVLAALTDRYRQLNQEITKRETLRWMLAPR